MRKGQLDMWLPIHVFLRFAFQLFKVFCSPFQSTDNLAFQRAPGYWKGYAHYAHNPLLSNPFSGSLWVCAEYAHINYVRLGKKLWIGSFLRQKEDPFTEYKTNKSSGKWNQEAPPRVNECHQRESSVESRKKVSTYHSHLEI